MEGTPKLHLKPMQKANAQLELHRPRFGVAAGMAIIGAAITTALILSPLNFAMGQDNKTDTATQKKDSKKVEEKAPSQIIAARLDTTLDKKGAVPTATKAIAEDKDKKPAMLARVDAKGKVLLAQTGIEQKSIVLAQANSIDVSNLPRVSLEELQDLELKGADVTNLVDPRLPHAEQINQITQLFKDASYPYYKVQELIETKEQNGYDYFYQTIRIYGHSENWDIIANVSVGWYEGKEWHNYLGVLDNIKKIAAVIDLGPLARMYKNKTGKDMKYVRLIAEQGRDSDGSYVNIHLIPVDAPNADINRGTIGIYLSYFKGTLYKPSFYVIN